jgi:hypothetical protein
MARRQELSVPVMKYLLVDTNLFLQCRNLPELPWSELADGQDLVVLMVPRAVQRELDQLKQDGNSRRASRARKASSLLRRIVLSDEARLELRSSGPKVEISFPPPTTLPSDCGFNLAETDDCIVAEALVFGRQHSDATVEVFSNDTSLLLTAKLHRVAFRVIPDDWLLPPEPDSRDKRIIELQNRVRALERQSPEIQISATVDGDTLTEAFNITVEEFEPLSETQLDAMVAVVAAKFPMVIDFPKDEPAIGLAGLTVFTPPSEQEIFHYKRVAYPGWLDEMRKLLVALPSHLESRRLSVNFILSNIGGAPAEHILVEFRSTKGLLLQEPPPKAELTRFPLPPKPPKGRRTGLFEQAQAVASWRPPGFDFSLPPIPALGGRRDRNTFYWKDRPSEPSDAVIFECEEFRHQIESEVFSLDLLVARGMRDQKSAVSCIVTASNLVQPASLVIPVTVQYGIANSEPQVRLLLKGSGMVE